MNGSTVTCMRAYTHFSPSNVPPPQMNYRVLARGSLVGWQCELFPERWAYLLHLAHVISVVLAARCQVSLRTLPLLPRVTPFTDTPMVIMWPNSDGSITLSQRQAPSEIMPTLVANPPKVATVAPALSTVRCIFKTHPVPRKLKHFRYLVHNPNSLSLLMYV